MIEKGRQFVGLYVLEISGQNSEILLNQVDTLVWHHRLGNSSINVLSCLKSFLQVNNWDS